MVNYISHIIKSAVSIELQNIRCHTMNVWLVTKFQEKAIELMNDTMLHNGHEYHNQLVQMNFINI